MKKNLLALLLLFGASCYSVSAKSDSVGPVPAAHQLKWHEAEIGVVFHYDLHVFDGKVYGQGNNRITPVSVCGRVM